MKTEGLSTAWVHHANKMPDNEPPAGWEWVNPWTPQFGVYVPVGASLAEGIWTLYTRMMRPKTKWPTP